MRIQLPVEKFLIAFRVFCKLFYETDILQYQKFKNAFYDLRFATLSFEGPELSSKFSKVFLIAHAILGSEDQGMTDRQSFDRDWRSFFSFCAISIICLRHWLS